MDTSRISLEFSLDRVLDDVRISVRSSRGEVLPARSLGLDVPTLVKFASAVQRAATRGKPLDGGQLVEAQTIQKALLAEGVGALLAQLHEASSGSVLVRFLVSDAELQTVPWESACSSGEALGFWAASAKVFPVRSVSRSGAWAPREIRAAVKVLAIAPTGSAGMDNLRQALEDRIQTGEIEWLDPLEGPGARVSAMLDRLRREPIPNVLHFLGHGTVDAAGRPALRLGDRDDEETWLPVELLAQQLTSSFRGLLRLIVLEACEGAKPSAFASAAEILARAGVDAVVAYAWPVRADVARTCSTEFYRAIAGADRHAGDVAMGLNEARRAILATHETSAEALGPVLYLRGPEGTIFDFKGRKVSPPKPSVTLGAGNAEVPKSLVRLLGGKFSLILGDRWKNDQALLDKFREKLQQELSKTAAVRAGLPMSTLAQWFALRKGTDKLSKEFQKSFRATTDVPPVFVALAKLLRPGVHTTLLRTPWLEQSLAEAQPNKTIYVLQPSDSDSIALKREAGSDDWEELDAPPSDVDTDEDFLILRPYRGYTPDLVFTPPLLTEDDYDLHLRDLWNPKTIPVDLKNALQRTLGYRPALILGLSVLTAHHRLLLRQLYTRGLPRESLAIIERDDKEAAMWEAGAGLPGREEGIEALEVAGADVPSMFKRLAEETGV